MNQMSVNLLFLIGIEKDPEQMVKSRNSSTSTCVHFLMCILIRELQILPISCCTQPITYILCAEVAEKEVILLDCCLTGYKE